MQRVTTKPTEVTNAQIAAMLDEFAEMRQLAGVNPFRAAAYRKAAVEVRRSPHPIAEVYLNAGRRGLEQLPGIGKALARRISEMVRLGTSKSLDRLREKREDGGFLTTLPTVGPRLAERLCRELDAATLEDVYAAARDGRLQRVAGFGRKRVDTIREALSARFPDEPETLPQDPAALPSVADLLALDRDYRRGEREGRWLMVEPRRYNPTGAAWLPVMKTTLHGVGYTVHYATSARSQALGRQHDWVVIYSDDKRHAGVVTIVTAASGTLKGRRVVRGRERECLDVDHQERRQLPLPLTVDPN